MAVQAWSKLQTRRHPALLVLVRWFETLELPALTCRTRSCILNRSYRRAPCFQAAHATMDLFVDNSDALGHRKNKTCTDKVSDDHNHDAKP